MKLSILTSMSIREGKRIVLIRAYYGIKRYVYGKCSGSNEGMGYTDRGVEDHGR